jgi:acetyl esterase/lipase
MGSLFGKIAGLALAGAATLAAVSAIAQGQRTFPTSATPSLADPMPNPPVRYPRGVTAYRDVVYQSIDGYRPQVVDIYLPRSPGPHPLVLYIHGGGWRGGHTRHSGALSDFPSVMASLASEGFVVASLEYRLSNEARFPAQLQDANAALRFLRQRAGQYRIDPARVGLWGGSAGGHLAALTALTCRDTSLDPAADADGCVQAVVGWYPVFDFAAMARPGRDDTAERQLLGCRAACPAEAHRRVSPVTYIDGRDPPFLLIHGDQDRVVPIDQSYIGERALRAAGVPVESIYISGVDHSFIGADTAATRTATLRATNATFDFFRQRLGVAQR